MDANRDFVESDVADDCKGRLAELISEGKKVEATSPTININKAPDYLDEQRFKRAQATCQKYYTNLSLASSTGLILLMQIESILVPLLKTGKSRTVPNLFDRYVTTAKYIRKLYETDFYDETTDGWRCISFVRGMHKKIHNSLKADTSLVRVPPDVWVNQYDMALTQFAFIGLFLLKPEKCGAYHVTRNDLCDITYYWRLISYYFGIEERFNLFVYDGDLDKQLKYLSVIQEHQNDLLKGPRPEVGLRMAEGFMFAFEDFSTESSLNILDHWWSPYISLSGKQQLSPYTWSDRWKLVFFLFYFVVLFRSEIIMGFMNTMYKRKFDKFCASGDRIKLKLAKKYEHHICELEAYNS